MSGAGSATYGPSVADSLHAICCTEKFADVHFIVGQSRSRVPGHKSILAARSDVFAAMLFGGMKESLETADIPVPDLPVEAFQNVLWYLYTNHANVKADTGNTVLE